MYNDDATMMFKREDKKNSVKETLEAVWKAMEEKGYKPADQLAGYLLSGDPSYITAYKDARNMLRRHERYELLEELLLSYMNKNK